LLDPRLIRRSWQPHIARSPVPLEGGDSAEGFVVRRRR